MNLRSENNQNEYLNKKDEFSKERDLYDRGVRRREQAERILENCRAGILASGLEEGQKCPVCGSVHHPEPARLPEQVVTEEELKNLKSEESSLLEKKNKAMAEVESARA